MCELLVYAHTTQTRRHTHINTLSIDILSLQSLAAAVIHNTTCYLSIEWFALEVSTFDLICGSKLIPYTVISYFLCCTFNGAAGTSFGVC